MSCAARKKSAAAPAKDLYESPLFKKARAYAERCADGWYVLSARHGLVAPGQVIEPYDVTLNTMDTDARARWAALVAAQLEEVVTAGDRVVMLAGQRYREGVTQRLRSRGVRVEAPMAGMRIGEQLRWLADRSPAPRPELRRRSSYAGGKAAAGIRASDPGVLTATPTLIVTPLEEPRLGPLGPEVDPVRSLYALVMRMAERFGVAPLGAGTAALRLPERGVYFFLDPWERRSHAAAPYRIVRVGTHALKRGARSTLESRLNQHRGSAAGNGNHRGSVFRLHVGLAMLARDGASHPTWGIGSAASREVIAGERDLEERVSSYLARLLVTFVPVPDEPRPESARGFIERNAIALLAGERRPSDPPSPAWLGHDARSTAIRSSGLWNVRHVDDAVDPGFLERLESFVEPPSRRLTRWR